MACCIELHTGDGQRYSHRAACPRKLAASPPATNVRTGGGDAHVFVGVARGLHFDVEVRVLRRGKEEN